MPAFSKTAARVPDLASHCPEEERAPYQVALVEDRRTFPFPEIPGNAPSGVTGAA